MSDLTQQEQQFFETGGETAPEAPETVAETPAETPVVETLPEPAEPKMVPLAALHEARSQNKEFRAALAKAEADRQIWEKRFAEINEKLTPKAQIPSFEENPAEHLRAQQAQLAKEQEAIKQGQEQATKEQQFAQWYQSQAAQFAQKTPDFHDAYKTLLEGRQQELSEQGMAPQQIMAKMRQEEQLLAVTAAQMGMNPAQLVYQTAIAKGYKPAQEQQPAQPAQNKLQNVADGIKSGKSLSQVPGRPAANLTAEYVANMSASEWDDWNKNWEENMGKLVA